MVKKSLPKRSSVFQKYNLRLATIQVTEIMCGSSGILRLGYELLDWGSKFQQEYGTMASLALGPMPPPRQ